MNSINDINNEKVRNLAKTLRESGLAVSETEAIRMAKSMTQTESAISKKATDKSHESKEKVLREPEEPKKESSEEEIPKTVEKYEQNLIKDKPQESVVQQKQEQKQEEEPDLSKVSLYEAAGIKEEPEQEQSSQETQREESETETQKEDSDPESQEESKEESKPTFKTPERKPKKDLSEFEEASVDLSNVFNSSNK